MIFGNLHVPAFQTDKAYVVTENCDRVLVKGFLGRNRALHGDRVAAELVRHRIEESCEDPGKRLKTEIEFLLSTAPNSKMDMKDLSIQESVHPGK